MFQWAAFVKKWEAQGSGEFYGSGQVPYVWLGSTEDLLPRMSTEFATPDLPLVSDQVNCVPAEPTCVAQAQA